jgi:hypothetical protein
VTRFDEDAILRIAIRTPVRVRDIAKALNALEIAYSKTYVLYDRMARLSQLARLTETEEIIRQFSRMSEMLHLRIPAPYPGWEHIPASTSFSSYAYGPNRLASLISRGQAVL